MLFHRLLRDTPAREKLYDKTQAYLPCILFFSLNCPFFLFFLNCPFFSVLFVKRTGGKLNDKTNAHTSRLLFVFSFAGAGCGCVHMCAFTSSWTTPPPKAFYFFIFFRFAPSQVHGRRHLRKHSGFHSGIACVCVCVCVFVCVYVCVYTHMLN
jgi:hypothetical protein